MFKFMPALVVAMFAFPEESSVRVFSRVSEKWYMAECTEDMVSKTPKWDEDSESPPVSPKKAIQLATKVKDSLVEDHDDFSLRSLSLLRMEGGWVWSVLFVAHEQEDSGDGPPELPDMICLYVLLDGTVLKPTETTVKLGPYLRPTEDESDGAAKKSSISK